MNITAICDDHRKWSKSSGLCKEDDDNDPKIVVGFEGSFYRRLKKLVKAFTKFNMKNHL